MRKTLVILALIFPCLLPRAWGDPVSFSLVRPLFTPLISDPREPSIGMEAFTSERGYESSLGGSVDFLRWKASPDMEWGLGIFAGLWVLSDQPDFSGLAADDWFSGAYLSEKSGPFSLRFEFQDQKSDTGDSLYGQKNIGFTRDNFNLTLSLEALRDVRLYAGGGLRWPWDDFIKSQSQAFLFTGLEAYSPSFSFIGPCRAYGAYHFKFQDQAGGTYNHEVQLGLRWKGNSQDGSSLRLALIYYNGHSEFGEFFQREDAHGGIGVFYDP